MSSSATAIAACLPLFTTNPDDFTGLETLMRIIAVILSAPPHG
jgi:hypothetical protein